ncbi:MAG: hypothetical protein AAF403_01495, partial [Pseudomonadota bacterium]
MAEDKKNEQDHTKNTPALENASGHDETRQNLNSQDKNATDHQTNLSDDDASDLLYTQSAQDPSRVLQQTAELVTRVEGNDAQLVLNRIAINDLGLIARLRAQLAEAQANGEDTEEIQRLIQLLATAQASGANNAQNPVVLGANVKAGQTLDLPIDFDSILAITLKDNRLFIELSNNVVIMLDLNNLSDADSVASLLPSALVLSNGRVIFLDELLEELEISPSTDFSPDIYLDALGTNNALLNQDNQDNNVAQNTEDEDAEDDEDGNVAQAPDSLASVLEEGQAQNSKIVDPTFVDQSGTVAENIFANLKATSTAPTSTQEASEQASVTPSETPSDQQILDVDQSNAVQDTSSTVAQSDLLQNDVAQNIQTTPQIDVPDVFAQQTAQTAETEASQETQQNQQEIASRLDLQQITPDIVRSALRDRELVNSRNGFNTEISNFVGTLVAESKLARVEIASVSEIPSGAGDALNVDLIADSSPGRNVPNLPPTPPVFDPFSGVSSVVEGIDVVDNRFKVSLGAVTEAVDSLATSTMSHTVTSSNFSGNGGDDTIIGNADSQTIFGDYGASATVSGDNVQITKGSVPLVVKSIPISAGGEPVPDGSLDRIIFSGTLPGQTIYLEIPTGATMQLTSIGESRWSLPLNSQTISQLDRLRIDNVMSGASGFTLTVESVIDNVVTQRLNSVVRAGELPGGNDRILAGGGDDLVFGEDGNDVLDGEAGSDRLYGGAGDDVLFAGREGDGDIAASQDVISGGEGRDRAIIRIDRADLDSPNTNVRADISDLQNFSRQLRSGFISDSAVLSRRNTDGQYVFENLGLTLSGVEQIDIQGAVFVQPTQEGRANAPIYPLSLFASARLADPQVNGVVIGNIPTGISLNAGGVGEDGRYTISRSQLDNLEINTPTARADFTLQVRTIDNAGQVSSRAEDLPVVISGVVKPTLSVNVNPVNEGDVIQFGLSVGIVGTSDSLTRIEFVAPPDATLSHGTRGTNGRWTLTRSDFLNFGNSLRITPPVHFGGTFRFSALAIATDGPDQAIGRISVDTTVRPIADTAEVSIPLLTNVIEDKTTTLAISASVIDTDGSETLVVYIANIPNDTKLSNGIVSNGIWTLNRAQLSNLTIIPAIHSSRDFTAQITVLTSEAEGTSTSVVTSSMYVNLIPVADTPTLQTANTKTNEDQVVALDVSVNQIDTDNSETLIVQINNVPRGARLSAGTLIGQFWQLNRADLVGLKLTPLAHSDVDLTLGVTAIARELNTSSTSTSSSNLVVVLNPVLDTAQLDSRRFSLLEDQSIRLNLSIRLKDTDASETFTSIVINDLPFDAVLSSGTNLLGAWTLKAHELNNLRLTPSPHMSGDFSISVTAVSRELSGFGQVSQTTNYQFTITGVADQLVADADRVSTIPNVPVALDLSLSYADTDGSETILYIIASNVPTGASLSAGTFSQGRWSVNASQLNGLQVTPPLDSKLSFSITISAISSEVGTSTTAVTTFNQEVAITPIADSAIFTLTGTTSGFEEQSIPLLFSVGLKDTDGSETLSVMFSLPTGISLSGGTVNAGRWTLVRSQLSNLRITAPDHYAKDFTIFVTSITSEIGFPATSLSVDQLPVNFVGIVDTAKLEAKNQSGFEDKAIPFSVSVSLVDTDGSETIQAIIASGAPTGTSFSAGVLNEGKWTFSISDLANLTLKAPAHSDVDFSMVITAVSRELDGDSTALTSQVVSYSLTAVTDSAQFVQKTASGFEDTPISLSLSVGLADTDGSETLAQIHITGVPSGASLSSGVLGADGKWTLNQAQLSGLSLTPVANSGEDFTLQISALTSEISINETVISVSNLVVNVQDVADTASLQTRNVSGFE